MARNVTPLKSLHVSEETYEDLEVIQKLLSEVIGFEFNKKQALRYLTKTMRSDLERAYTEKSLGNNAVSEFFSAGYEYYEPFLPKTKYLYDNFVNLSKNRPISL